MNDMETKKELTKRQLEVMNLVKHGYANKQISRELGISIWTVKRHLHDIIRRTRANDRAHAVYICLKRGIID